MIDSSLLAPFSTILIGGAIGDCFGSYYEGKEGPCRYVEHDDWQLTDDTILNLATAEGIIAVGNIDLQSISDTFTDYFKRGKINRIGSSTLKALIDLSQGISPLDSGHAGERAAGNGPASRMAPLAKSLRVSSSNDRKIIRQICRITHKNDEAYSAALAVLAALNCPRLDAINSALAVIPDSNTKDKLQELQGLTIPIGKAAQITGVTGYSAESVPLALYASDRANEIGFKRVIIEVSCCGGDADTIASIAGQIMASKKVELPADWVNKIPDLDTIISLGNKLEQLFNRSQLNNSD